MASGKKVAGLLIGAMICTGLQGASPQSRIEDAIFADITTAAVTALVAFPLLQRATVSSSRTTLVTAAASGCTGLGIAAISGPIFIRMSLNERKVVKVMTGMVSAGLGTTSLLCLAYGNRARAADAAVIAVPYGIACGRMLWKDRNLKPH